MSTLNESKVGEKFPIPFFQLPAIPQISHVCMYIARRWMVHEACGLAFQGSTGSGQTTASGANSQCMGQERNWICGEVFWLCYERLIPGRGCSGLDEPHP
jgi:hypothetical protein